MGVRMFISKKRYEKLENEISDLREELRNCKSTIRFLAFHKKDDVVVDLVHSSNRALCTIVVEYLKDLKKKTIWQDTWILWHSKEIVENNNGYAIIKLSRITNDWEMYLYLNKSEGILKDITIEYQKLIKDYGNCEQTDAKTE